MSIDYVKKTYGMPWIKVGLKVQTIKGQGVITSATHYIFVRLEGNRHPLPFHPKDVTQIEG